MGAFARAGHGEDKSGDWRDPGHISDWVATVAADLKATTTS